MTDSAEEVVEQVEVGKVVEKGSRKRSGRPHPAFHIIAMDGGGIYGLATAELLKQLCHADEAFLSPDDMDQYLFAGTSAGAVNALLLANEKSPRDFILKGGLDAFWRSSPIFDGPEQPWEWTTSLLGLTPWFGQKAYHDSLQAIFGRETRIGELRHKVFVCVFDYFGHAIPNPAVGKSWGPFHYSNFLSHLLPVEGEVLEAHKRTDRVADIAYAAAAPAGYRAFVDGLGDGGASLPTPELYAVLAVGRDVATQAAKDPGLGRKLRELEPRVSMLSLGVCTTPWFHWKQTFCDLGYNTFWSWFPTNPAQGNWYPPIYDFDISAPTSTSNQQTRDLLGPAYFRLSPALFGPPTATPPELVAMLWARNPQLKGWLIAEIEKAVRTDVARMAVLAAREFLAKPGWKKGVEIRVGALPFL